MAQVALPAVFEHFANLTDPRIDRTKRHKLIDIVVLTICAVAGGADSWTAVEEWGKSKESWLRRMLELPNGIPSHDTIGRLFRRINTAELERCFINWMKAAGEVVKGDVVAMDGKTVRGSYDRYTGKDAIHMISAWACQSKLVLGQLKTDDRSNEITAIPELLDSLTLKGCTVTIDAMGCQKDIARKIRNAGADYVLAVKGNHKHLLEGIEDIFDTGAKLGFGDDDVGFERTWDMGHGRIERRRCWAVSGPEYLDYVDEGGQWPDLRTLVKVEGMRIVDGKTTVQARYYISSLPNDARRILAAVRSHWGVENELHWCLDVAFKEDGSRVRSGYGAENFSMIRRIVLNLLKATEFENLSFASKRRRATWDEGFLLKVITQI